MSSLWTPGGERPVPRPGETASPPTEEAARAGSADRSAEREPTEAELRQQMDELRARLANTPAEVVVANHAFGLFELAALHLSLDPPQLDQARLAIDALGALVEGLGDRLGDHGQELLAGLSQLRMAYVQIQGAQGSPPASPPE